MHVGKLIEELGKVDPATTVAVQHPRGGYTSLGLELAVQQLSVPHDYDRSDGVGEWVPVEGGREVLTLQARTHAHASEINLPKRLFFCHIPKTAGGALSKSIRSLFPGYNVIDFESSAPLFRKSDAELSRARLLAGHAGANLAHRLPPDTITLTVLRDPVARVISNYNFFLARGVIRPGLKEFVSNPDNRWAVNNLMAWQLAHDHTSAGRRDEPYRDWSEGQLQSAAISALRKINIVGMADNLDEVLDRLEAVYETRPEPLSRVNEVDKEITHPSDEEVDLIRSVNTVDQAVYDEAMRIKDESWERTRQLITKLRPTNHFI